MPHKNIHVRDKDTPYTSIAWFKNGKSLKYHGHTQELSFYKNRKCVLDIELDRSNAIKLAIDLITTGIIYDPKKENIKIICPCKS